TGRHPRVSTQGAGCQAGGGPAPTPRAARAAGPLTAERKKMMNKRLAELLKKRTELKKEARDLVEATDIPLEELERKSEAVVKALAEVEAAIEALKKLLDVAEEVDQEAAQTESAAEAIAEGSAEADPAAPTDEGRPEVRGKVGRARGKDEW